LKTFARTKLGLSNFMPCDILCEMLLFDNMQSTFDLLQYSVKDHRSKFF